MKTTNYFMKITIFLMILTGGIILVTYVLTPEIPSFYKENHYDVVFLEQVSHTVLLIHWFSMNII